MPGYTFQVSITLTNSTNAEQIVRIPRGTIIEPHSTHLSYQSAVVAKDYIFKLNAKETRSVLVDAECWNQHLSPPQGVPGKLTPLKGNVQKTTNVWGVSSAPQVGTLTTKPTQRKNVFSAFANSSPKLAFEFLDKIVDKAAADGVNVKNIRDELNAIASATPDKDQLYQIAEFTELANYVKAEDLREFFIMYGTSDDEHIEAIELLVKNIYALTSHKLASSLYDVGMELKDLSDNRKITVKHEKQQELTSIIRQKYISILDAFPLLDGITW